MLPREIQVEHWPDRAVYDLPIRPLGKLRLVGLLPMAFASLFLLLPGGFAVHTLRRAIAGPGNPVEWFMLIFLSVFCLGALYPFMIGVFVLCGRTRVVLAHGTLKVTEIAGLLRWSRKVRVQDIVRLEVAEARKSEAANVSTPEVMPLKGLGAVVAVLGRGKRKFVLLGYPTEWIQAVAEELSGSMQLEGRAVPVTLVQPQAAGEAAESETKLTQPADSNARLTERAGGIELEVPSRGFWKESAGLMTFAIMWCAFMLFFTAMMLLAGHKKPVHFSQLTILGAFFAVFWGIGIGMVVLAIHMGTRRWEISAREGTLEISLHSRIRTRTWKWAVSELHELKAGDSGMEVNNRRLQELQMVLAKGKKVGLMRGRSREELEWIASRLRAAIKLQAPQAVQTA